MPEQPNPATAAPGAAIVTIGGPATGGSYIRNPDQSLTLVHQTTGVPGAPETPPTPQPPAANPAAPAPPAPTPAAKEA